MKALILTTCVAALFLQAFPACADAANAATVIPAPLKADILAPAPDALLDAPAVSVTVRFPEGAAVRLRVNDVPVKDAQVGRTETDTQTHLTTQTWVGVVLRHGPNTISAQAVVDGSVGPVAAESVHVRAQAEMLTLTPRQSKLRADGRATVTVLGRLLDHWGRPAGGEAVVFLDSTAGKWLGTNADPDQPGFHVIAHDGQFVATLRAGTHAQTVQLRGQVGAMTAQARVEFLTDLRPSLVAGVVNVSVGKGRLDYDRPVQDFLQNGGTSDRSTLRVSSSGFATGAINGTLVSGAYNSDHGLNQTAGGASSLGRDTQVEDQRYLVYGDSSESEAQAESRDHLFLRLERDNNYALWGDYGTSEFTAKSQQFTALSREFHALKTNLNFGALQATGFYGSDVQGFQRDTLTPDGTGGYYFLSHRPLVYGSENVVIELDDLTRPGVPVQSENASRGTDYEIDYDRGTLLFHHPLQRTDVGTDGRVLGRRIVVTYQYQTGGRGTSVYGGRLQMHLAGGGGLLGTTFIRQNQGVRRFNLYGADTLIPLGAGGSLVAEYARSENGSELLGPVSGSAYRVEAQGTLGVVRAQVYLRSVGTGFANDATTSFVPGQTRVGAQAAVALGRRTHLRAQIDRETDKGVAPTVAATLDGQLDPGATALPGARVDNALTTVSAGVEQQVGPADVSMDLIARHRTDALNPATLSGDSRHLETRFSLPLPPRVTLMAQSDVTVSQEVDAVEPDRSLVGVSYAVTPGIDMRVYQQWFGRGQFRGRSVTSFETVAQRPWGDGDLSERFSISGGANGATVQQSLGLERRWAVAPGLHVSGGYERTGGALLGRTQAGPQYSAAYTPGQSAAVLGYNGAQSESIGIDYTRPADFKASLRLDNRTSAGGRNVVLTGGAAGKISRAWTSLLDYEQAQASNPGLESLGRSVTLRLGLAYRDPQSDKWNALLRYEFRRNPATTPDTLLVGSGTGSRDETVAAEAIYAPEWQWEFYAKLAERDTASYLANDYVGSSRLTLAQVRATYRFRSNMDLLGEARWISEPAAGYGSRGTHLELGYYATPELRVGVGYSFGRLDDRDFSGAQWDGGFMLGVTAKVDQLFGGFGVQRDTLDAPGGKK